MVTGVGLIIGAKLIASWRCLDVHGFESELIQLYKGSRLWAERQLFFERVREWLLQVWVVLRLLVVMWCGVR